MIKRFFRSQYRGILVMLADKAVKFAEETGGSGQAKKLAAISYIVKVLPLNPILKPFIGYLLREVIDEAVEFAILRLKQKKIAV